MLQSVFERCSFCNDRAGQTVNVWDLVQMCHANPDLYTYCVRTPHCHADPLSLVLLLIFVTLSVASVPLRFSPTIHFFLFLVDSVPPFFLFFPLLVFWVHPLDSILIWCLFLSFILYFSSPELDWSVRKWMFSNKKSLKCRFCSFPFFPSFFGVCHSYSVYLLFISLIPLMNFCTLQPQMVKQEAPGGRGLA